MAFRVDSEYSRSWANAKVKAGDAHARGLTGAGQTVALFDTGLANHAEFKDRIVTGYDAVLGTVGAPNDVGWHGTFVAGVVGAARDGRVMEGIAYDSKLMAVRIANKDGTINLPDANLAKGIRYTIGKAGVLNNSWNMSATINQVSRAAFERSYAQSLAAWRDAVNNNAVVVWAAGNQGAAEVGLFGALPAWYGDLRKGWIVAVATDQSGAIASYSNRCGSAAAWCLAAPGSNLVSTYVDGAYAVASGTSFAAPVVAGGAAVLKQLWPHLTNEQITGILFRTANKTGIYAQSLIYGQGLLDMEAATRPVGTTGIATGGTTKTTTSTASSLAITSSAFGKSLQQSARNEPVMVLDEYERDFYAPLSSFVTPAATSFNLKKGVRSLGDGLEPVVTTATLSFAMAPSDDPASDTLPRFVMRETVDTYNRLTVVGGVGALHLFGGEEARLGEAGLLAKGEAAGSAYLGLAGQEAVAVAWTTRLTSTVDMSFGGFHGSQADKPSEWQQAIGNPYRELEQGGINGMVARVDATFGSSTVAVHAGMVREEGTLLGAASEGALSLASGADTAFAGLSFSTPLGAGVSAFGGVEGGWTSAAATDNSLVSGLSDIETTAFHLGLAKTGVVGEQDRLGFVISQPLRVTGGEARFRVPVARDLDGQVTYVSSRHDLSADGRETDLQLGYSAGIGAGQTVTMAGLVRLQPDNIADASTETVVMARYRLRF